MRSAHPPSSSPDSGPSAPVDSRVEFRLAAFGERGVVAMLG